MNRRHALLLLVLAHLFLPLAGALAAPTPAPTLNMGATRRPDTPSYDPDHPEKLMDSQIVAHSFYLMERSTGLTLRERDADVIHFPASITKIMTLLVALKYAELTDVLTISSTAMDIPDDASRVPFSAGEQVTMEDALYGMILKSGNEAANAIAEYVAGDIPSFAQLMNEEAWALGCKNTNFVNPHGLHNESHYTTAEDLALIMDAGLNFEEFRKILGTPTYTLSSTNINPARTIKSTDQHMDNTNANRYYKPVFAGKTGNHEAAGYTLIEAASRNGIELIAVVLNTGFDYRWLDTHWLFEYGFTQFKSVTPEQIYLGVDPAEIMEQSRRIDTAPIATPNPEEDAQEGTGEAEESGGNEEPIETEPPDEPDDIAIYTADDLPDVVAPLSTVTPREDTRLEVEIRGFDLNDEQRGLLRLDIRAVDPDRVVRITDTTPQIDAIIANFSAYTNLRWITDLRAPIEKGQVLGILTFFPDKEEPADYELIAERSIAARENAPPTLEEIERRVLEDPSIFPPFAWEWVLPPVLAVLGILFALLWLIRKLFKGRRKKKKIPKPQKRYFN